MATIRERCALGFFFNPVARMVVKSCAATMMQSKFMGRKKKSSAIAWAHNMTVFVFYRNCYYYRCGKSKM